MNIITKLKFIDSLASIFSIKLGDIVKNKENGKCYCVPKVVSIFFSIFHYGGIGAFLAIVIFLLLPNIFDSILFTIFVTITLYILIEVVLLLLIPFKEIECWKKDLNLNNKKY
ncbi:MAG: hypothetical protein K0U47_09670 [Epsilonproteobacteria bacterium]|nr:hypothetical protein [Campylobacterota bacterium]